ncbi:MAG: protein-disulfide reductase DsbD domain-containing protein [Novosphingobium sp.]
MPIPRYRHLVTLLLLFAAAFAAAFATPALAAPNHIAARLVAEAPVSPGGTATLAIEMTPERGWHGYWSNPGDAGYGMKLDWQIPAGITAGEPRYPVPQTLVVAGLMNHVYEHAYAVLVPMKVGQSNSAGVLPITLNAQWLACTDQICVPERATLQTTLAVTTRPTQGDPRFDRWRAALPAPLGAEAHFTLDGKTLRLGIPLPAALELKAPHVFPAQDHLIAYAALQDFRRKGDMLIVTLQRPAMTPATPATLDGVLRLNDAGDGVEFKAVPGPVPLGGEPLAGSAPASSLPALLLAAMLGGLLLNVMPCVFPILSLKALSLARAGGSEAEARTEGLAYTAGVVLAVSALGAALLALRAGGQELGWAFQLQEPGVVAALLLLAAAITANLAGLFEFAIPGFASTGSNGSKAGGSRGAFATGLLAAFVATPCTGPFMAAAMGAALVLPVAQGMALFAALGIGLALPFLALAFIPALRRLLPRPGAWMGWFKMLMAVPMGLTACALLWLCWRLGGGTFVAVIAAIALVFVGALAAIGKVQRKGESVRTLVAIAALIAIGGVLGLPAPAAPPQASASLLASEQFSETALATARASGKPVFVYFTADWCLTCKVNEAAAIEREEVRDAFVRAGVKVLVGDWTRRDPAITRFLTEQGAAGVPLYLWYAPRGQAEQLPQVLSAGLLAGKAGG